MIINENRPGDYLRVVQPFTVEDHQFRIGDRVLYLDHYQDRPHENLSEYSILLTFQHKEKIYTAKQDRFISEDTWSAIGDYFHQWQG